MQSAKPRTPRTQKFGLGIKFKGYGASYAPGEYERLQAEKAQSDDQPKGQLTDAPEASK